MTAYNTQVLALRLMRERIQASSLWSVQNSVLSSKIPVLTLRHVLSDCKVDLVLNFHFGVQKTAMLREMLVDPNLRRLVMLVKFWARRRQVYG